MDDVVAALHDQLDELDALVAPIDDADFERPSACPGWSVADVLIHLAQTNEAATASTQHRLSDLAGQWGTGDGRTVDDDAAAAVDSAPVTSGPDAYAWWKRSADEMASAFATIEPATRVQWVAGDMAARSLCTTRIAETWIHTNDIADGLDATVAPTDRLHHIARLVHRTIPYAFQRAGEPAPGPVHFALLGPSGEQWRFGDDDAPTRVEGTALDLCTVAGQRGDAVDTGLRATGPDAELVLRLMRTFA